MACYAALASAVDLLHDILHTHTYPNFILAGIGREILNSLHQNFVSLLDSLDDYFEGCRDVDVVELEARIRDAAYRVEDIIAFEILEQHTLGSGSTSSGDVVQNLKNVRQEVDSFLKGVEQVSHKRPRVGPSRSNSVHDHSRDDDWAESTPIQKAAVLDGVSIPGSIELENLSVISEGVNDSIENLIDAEIFAPFSGFDRLGFGKRDHRSMFEIRDRLFGNLSLHFQVIPIVGMGGLGKTHLAKKIFERTDVVAHFPCRVWVTVSRDYHVNSVLKSILESLGILELHDQVWNEEGLRRKCGLAERVRKKRRAVEDHIHEHLKGQRRFLIVIDDVRETKVWDDMKSIFPIIDSNESRVVLTTRSLDVARHATGSNYIHEMQRLDSSESWKLLEEKVFSRRQKQFPRQLEDLGRSIATMCGGLPLAILLISGVLSKDQSVKFWTLVLRKLQSMSNSDDERIYGILSLSFDYLPHQLKACFLYMGSFPPKYEISITRLCKLWFAEGFLRSSILMKTEEQEGRECIEDLIKKNLVLGTKRGIHGQFKCCTIHDVVRDFCRSKVLNECFFPDDNQEWHHHPNGTKKMRRIILNSFAHFNPWAYKDGTYVRSFCWFSTSAVPDISELDECGNRVAFSNVHTLEWGSLKQLKILDAADIETAVAPFSILRMIRLKHLALRLGGKKKKKVLESMFEFKNLQTLIINSPGCESISLPPEVWKMSQLRHLIIDNMILPPISKGNAVPLECLQTLQTVKDFVFTYEAVQMISKIRKLKLSFQGEEASGIWKLYCLNNLDMLFQLEILKINFIGVQFQSGCSFIFPLNLKELCLEGCQLPWEALPLVDSLRHLEVLKLRKDALVGESWVCDENFTFNRLKFLLLEDLNLRYLRGERSQFPCLEHLKIRRCHDLVEIPQEIGDIPTLKYIDIYECEHVEDSVD